ncbi:Ferredoxin:4Fe-4S ferredoxin [Salpingoeca rosetta]|uniref:Ferredoxin:4Fe-4S ferredoxin n=1 Tax=Salpingoeca rosetta (strain ATCC 50818 / BSB-021) TaxID=946362 RepID=F2U7G4_SALR5|nr:Ferredoxin:4Fe-4S ferredoxin [Salpingoeca rosetta]EGD83381.1 Ferredoxin:4Fe-4S ferredoxin [Salpingoeca rosetta]|eukprot:XP_004994885.1 Ferredoxin:4Fe-4S ferredoxin [Salpingoeca rosetta]
MMVVAATVRGVLRRAAATRQTAAIPPQPSIVATGMLQAQRHGFATSSSTASKDNSTTTTTATATTSAAAATAAAAAATAEKPVSVTINGKPCQASLGQTILEVARDNNLFIPTLCYHPSLKPVGTCRLCLVDVGGKKTVPACVTGVQDGMNVLTHTKEIEDEVQTLLALLRARHPMKCATCPVNGQCEFQDLLMRYQVEEPAFFGHEDRKSAVGRTHDHSSPAIQLDLDKCVLCTRCVRACQEIQGMSILGIASRGPYESVSPIMGKEIADTPCISCGACTAVCPVGAITEVPHLFKVLHLLEGDFTHEDLTRDEITRLGGMPTVRHHLTRARQVKTMGDVCGAQQAKAGIKVEEQSPSSPQSTSAAPSTKQPSASNTTSAAPETSKSRLRRPITIVHTAPAVRVTLGEAFGMEPGSISTGKLVSALRAVGFDYVFDTNFTADLTIMEEGTELLERVRTGGVFPMMTSCCPGWISECQHLSVV